MPPGIKSEYLFLGSCRASSVAGYQISVTSARGCRVKESIRPESTKTVVVTPTGNGPIARKFSCAGTQIIGIRHDISNRVVFQQTERWMVEIVRFSFML